MKMQTKLLRMAPLIILIAMFLTALASNATPEQATMPYNEVSNVVINGTIGTNEYAGNYSETTTGIDIYWEHNGTVMYVGLKSPGTGWVGIAFGPQRVGMKDANIIIGYVDDAGNLILEDNFGTGLYSHKADTDPSLGGYDNIVSEAGSQIGGKTIIEFVFPLDSGDQYDQSFSPGGTYGFNVAYHQSNDDFLIYGHTKHSASIDLYLEASGMPPLADFSYVLREFTVEFTDESSPQTGSIVSRFWDFGDGTNSTQPNPSHTYSEMDTYTVKLTVTDEGDTNTASKLIVVPSAKDRMQLWVTQVAIITIAIAFVSFTAVGIARKIEVRKEGKEHGGHT